MKNFSDSVYIETLADINQKLDKEISNSISKTGCCDFYIAVLNNTNRTEIFANNTSLFLGPERVCKKIFKDVLKRLKKSPYKLDGDLKDVIYITR